MAHPTFLIVGAAKAGSTLLFEHMQQHPQIYMNVKAPKFLIFDAIDYPHGGPDVDKITYIKTWAEYQASFAKAETGQHIGEASASYLYQYQAAIPNIKKYLGDDVRIIMSLREPVSRAFSAYANQVRDGFEPLSFREALAAEPQRIAENYPFIWHYQAAGYYHEQVKAYQEAFEHVHVILFDDIKARLPEVMAEAYRFLGVDDTFTSDYSRKTNVSGKPKSQSLYNFVFQQNRSPLKRFIKTVVPERLKAPIKTKLQERLFHKMKITPEDRAFLKAQYAEDIDQLAQQLGRDLSHWQA